MLVVWGRTNSINVQKVLWCLDELGLARERIDAGGAFGVVDTPAYRKLNPNGLVPTIVDDDGFVLWESNAIVRYLCAKHAPSALWPGDARVRASADRWMDWKLTTLWPTLRALFIALVRTPPDQRDAKTIEQARQKTAEALAIVEAHLASSAFLAGDAFTAGDIPLGCAVWRWIALPIERPAMPNVERWFGALSQRAPYKEHVMQPLS